MKILLILGIFSSSAWATTNCDVVIAKLNNLKTEFMRYDFRNDVDQGRGVEREDEAIEPIDDIDKLAKTDACRVKAWKAFVDLAQAQSPFDEESRAADVITNRLAADKSLQKPYNESLHDFPDRCRSQHLSSMVDVRICVDQQHKSVHQCNAANKFNFLKCIRAN